MLKLNESELIELAVQGQVIYPRCFGWEVTADGQAKVIPSVGGIVYNVKVGDSAYGYASDHIEPCVTVISGSDEKAHKDPNFGFNAFSCVGNEATIISGDAKGEKGIVTGHHGGVEHVMIDFSDETLEKMTQDDKVLIRGHGLGMRLPDYPDVSLYGLSPSMFAKMNITGSGGKLQIPVSAVVPAFLMGSGLGSAKVFKGDYDIQTADKDALKKHNLENLKLGDFVAIQDQQGRWGYSYMEGVVSVGIVVHGDSYLAGHGPGVQILITTDKKGLIEPKIDAGANIADYLKIGRKRG